MISPTRKISLVFGLFFAGTFVFSIPAPFFYGTAAHDAEGMLNGISGTRISMGALCEIFLAICNIATAVVIFPLTRRVSEPIALGYIALRIVESIIILMGVMSLLSVLTLRGTIPAGGDMDTLSMAGRLLLTFHDKASLLGPQFCAGFGNGILLGYLMYRSQLVPRRMAIIGLVGGPLAFIGGVLVLFGVLTMQSPGLLAFTALEIIWELSITIYPLVKGFRPSPLALGDQ